MRRDARLKAEAQERLRAKFGSGGMGSAGNYNGSGSSGPYVPRRRGGSGADDFVAGFEETTQKAAVAASKAWGVLSSVVSVGVSRVAQSASQLAAEIEKRDFAGKQNLQRDTKQSPNGTSASQQPAHASPVANNAAGKYGGVGNSMPQKAPKPATVAPQQASGAAALDKLTGSASQWFSSASAGLGSLWGELSAPAAAPAPSRAPSKYGSAGPSSSAQAPSRGAQSSTGSHSTSQFAAHAPAEDDDDAWLADMVPSEPQASAVPSGSSSSQHKQQPAEDDDAWADEAGWDWQEEHASPAPAPAPAGAAPSAPATASASNDDFFDDW